MGKTLGLDLGSAYTKFCVHDEKDARMTPSVITVDKKSDRVIASGNEAKAMIGRAPSSLEVIRPIKNGLVDDVDAAALLLTDLLERTESSSVFGRTAIVATIPFGVDKETRTLSSVIQDTGISTYEFVYTPIAIAFGTGMPVDIPTGRMIVDIGAGHSDAAIISHGDVVLSSIINTAGNTMTEAIRNYIIENHGIEVGELTAEAIKLKVATLDPRAPLKSVKIFGKVRADKNPKFENKITAGAVITSKELIPVLTPCADRIIENIVYTLKSMPTEIAADVTNFGILLSGGGAALNGFPAYVEKTLRIKANVSKTPQADAVRGLLEIINGGRSYAKYTH